MFTLSKSELEIMGVLWHVGKPLSRAQIIELSPQRSWKDSSIHVLLNSLLEKGAIQVSGFTKTGSHYGRTFSPTLPEAEYAVLHVQQLPAYQASPSKALCDILSALIDAEDLSQDHPYNGWPALPL